MARPYSLRRRLLVWLTLALIAVAALAIADTWREARDTASSLSDRVLAGSVLAIAERVIVTEDGALEVDVPYVALEMLTSAAQDRVFYRVDGPAGFITGYQNLPTLAGAGPEIVYSDAHFRGEPIRIAVLRRAASSGVSAIPFTVTVAETTIARSQLTQTLLLRSAIRLTLLIVVAGIILWLAVGFALAPLYRLRDAISKRALDDLSPIEQQVPKEVQGLVDTINSFMTRLSSALEALRHFTGNASHQLRTQLALAQRAETPEAARAAAGAADAAVVHAERVLAQLLLLARIDEAASDRLGFSTIDLTDLARERTGEYVVRAHAAGIDLGFEGGEPAPVAADPMLLGELIGNLIENAMAYAGDGAEATVRVVPEGDDVVLEVADTGRGLPQGQVATVRKRFSRGESERPGAGLGLSIVEEIAALFGGAVTVASEAGRGFAVTVRLPRAKSDQITSR
ncbi:sensor histidine kinase [Devosia sp. ZB163]|uniref:sensor histidine kinase n=1 Tax=Devosia sp. ZB163 TaxID=3025938 RepID=UPI0023600FFD|nr:sensor histidine kinase [Devosia sp. ZB163]MDC9822271.1 sensor histidine kinase [Devosia sp. ZB163]